MPHVGDVVVLQRFLATEGPQAARLLYPQTEARDLWIISGKRRTTLLLHPDGRAWVTRYNTDEKVVSRRTYAWRLLEGRHVHDGRRALKIVQCPLCVAHIQGPRTDICIDSAADAVLLMRLSNRKESPC